MMDPSWQRISVSRLSCYPPIIANSHVTAQTPSILCICLLILASQLDFFFSPSSTKKLSISQLQNHVTACECVASTKSWQPAHMAKKLQVLVHLWDVWYQTNSMCKYMCVFWRLNRNHMCLRCVPTPWLALPCLFVLHQSNLSQSCVYPSLQTSQRGPVCITIYKHIQIMFHITFRNCPTCIVIKTIRAL